jgi:TOBE domain
VDGRVFLGDKAEYVVRLNDAALLVVQWNPVAGELFAIGQQVSVRLPAADVQLLPAARTGD